MYIYSCHVCFSRIPVDMRYYGMYWIEWRETIFFKYARDGAKSQIESKILDSICQPKHVYLSLVYA